jgi:hypothetical protein
VRSLSLRAAGMMCIDTVRRSCGSTLSWTVRRRRALVWSHWTRTS